MPSTPPVKPIRAPDSKQPRAMTYHSNDYPLSMVAQSGHGGIHPVDRPYFQPFYRLLGRIRLGDQGQAEAKFGRFPQPLLAARRRADLAGQPHRSEEPTSELQSLMRISYDGFCLKKKK